MSENLPVVRLTSDRPLSGPWVFGRDVAREPGPREGPRPGDLVEVLDASERYLATGLWNPHSDLRVRLLSRGRRSEARDVRELLLRRLASADRLRRKVLRIPEHSDTYRVAHAEGDDLPGLIVDKLGPVLVCEHHALGFWRLRSEVQWALGQLYPGLPVVHRVPPRAAAEEGYEGDPTRLLEPAEGLGEVELDEHGLRFLARPAGGHKTGWFCDQRENRRTVASLAAGRDVLDLCCNAGGFSLACARAGARRVVGVDLDEEVLYLARRSAERAGLAVEWRHADLFTVLRERLAGTDRPDLVILDPHKLIPSRARQEEGLKRYGDMNALALELVRPGGLLVTFSCSGALALADFVGLVFRAARRAQRDVRLLATLEAGPDHPQRPDFTRSRYLKGLVLALD